MKYCYMEDGKVILGPIYLPTSWKNISGLTNLTQEQLAEFGWVPFEPNAEENVAVQEPVLKYPEKFEV